MAHQVLALDISGRPFEWISPQEALLYYTNKKVAWDLGDEAFVFRGGISRAGIQSRVTVKPIIAIANSERMGKMMRPLLPLGDDNTLLFARDRNMCAYCGEVFARQHLSRDHVLARSRGGADHFLNCVTACKTCNHQKGSKLVHEFKDLIYLPYQPCRAEHFLLSGRHIIADQMSYLSANLPAHSRMLS